MSENNRLMYFPIAFFPMVMGLAGLSIATQQAEKSLGIVSVLGTLFGLVTLGVFAVVATLYVLKFKRYRQAVNQEFNHPIKLHFFPAISIGLLLLGGVFLPLCKPLSFVLWSLGAILHLVFTLKIVSLWMHHQQFEFNHMNPSWFLPAVGNVIAPIAGVAHAPIEISWFFFSVGLIFWVLLLVIFFNRVIFHPMLPPQLLPTLFILLAPPAIGFIAYLRLVGQLDAFAYILYFFALFTLMLLIVQYKVFIKLPFFMSWWAYSFPSAAMTIATFIMAQQSGQGFFYGLAWLLYVALFALIILLLKRTYLGIKNRKICVEGN
ncbi:MAG: C4-dicarboxylate ABC transporter [Gammaproteobacteria bacterium]|nr:MAG: C4-dicarboxylate ABC transporter [Gammaproteobacteria bacterium]